jgi:hypothetical protein|tara:strand:+ start:352 stop:564 length:213 start_codon:yes stop_codon:yes gene_type:complete
MATILPELIKELEAKTKRLEKDVVNIDKSSVIPEHTNKAEAIIKTTKELIETEEVMKYLLRIKNMYYEQS